MCSRKNCTIDSPIVHQYALAQLGNFLNLSNSGYKCKKDIVLNVLLLAASSITSIYAICKKLTKTPTGRAIINALQKSFPDIDALELQINQGLCPYGKAYKSLKRKARKIAIDLTLRPYHGQPLQDKHEIFRSQPKSGTTHFHAYATAYVCDKGHRYNLAVTFVRGNEKMDVVVKRLAQRVRKLEVKIKYLLLDRGFFSVKVIRYLKNSRTPFLMPVVMRGRKRKNPKAKETNLRQFLKKRNGKYSYRMKSPKDGSVMFDVCVASKKYFNKKLQKDKMKKMVYALWRVQGNPIEIREQYRKRFGIESSYRQLNQAKIATCTRDPMLRLLYFGVELIMLNVWIWLHATFFTEKDGRDLIVHLEKLRFKEMLQWIEQVAEQLLHDGKPYTVDTS